MIKIKVTGYSVCGDTHCQENTCNLHEPSGGGQALQADRSQAILFSLIFVQYLVNNSLSHMLVGII
jgi:hypothetical protein